MQISNQLNDYQSLSIHQKPIGEEISPEKRLETTSDTDENPTQIRLDQENQQKEALVSQIGQQSAKTQNEIYMSVALSGKAEQNNTDTIDSINTLRDIQKQNSSIQAHAKYQEQQNHNIASLLGA